MIHLFTRSSSKASLLSPRLPLQSATLLFLLGIVFTSFSCESPPPDYQEFHHRMNTNLCQSRFRCCTTQEAAARIPYEDTEEGCIKALDDAYLQDWGKIQSDLDAGTLHYDPEAASECLKADVAQTQNCDASYEVAPFIEACSNVLMGTLVIGAACEYFHDLCAMSYCDAPDGTQGVCREYAKVGEPCTARCTPGLECSTSGVCAPPAQPGESCTYFLQCTTWTCRCSDDACNGRLCASVTVREAICAQQ